MGIEVAFQRALYQRLTPLGHPVYDAMPQARDGGGDATFPCFVIGQIIPAKWDTYAETGFDIAFRLHVRSRSRGMLETKDLQSLAYDLLHRAEFSVDGFRLILCDRQSSTCDHAADGSFHGIDTYRALVARD